MEEFYSLRRTLLIFWYKLWDRCSRSRRFTILLLISAFLLFTLFYKLSSGGSKYSPYSAELESCASQNLERYQSGIQAKNVVVYELPYPDLTSEQLRKTQENSQNKAKQAAKPLPLDEISLLNVDLLSDTPGSSRFFLPYTGNGYIGVSITNQNTNGEGLYANYQKTLSLPLMFSPLASLFTDGYERKEVLFVDLFNGIANKIQCYQINSECVSVLKSVYAHRTRPSVLVEEITFNNPTKDAITFDVVQMGAKNWNQSKYSTDNFNGMEFSITNGIIDVVIDNKLKHLCVSIGTTKLANNIRLKEHEFNSRFYSITVVKYSTTFLSGKLENLEPILNNLQSLVIGELKEATSLGFSRLKKEHSDAWNAIWRSGFGISHSLAWEALNADRINASIYYVLANHRAPLIEVKQPATSTNSQIEQQPLPVILEFNMERCYEGFSTLHATTLWKLPSSEQEAASLTSLWSLTLQKHGCKNLVELGVDGVLQAVILSLGGLKFTHHHLDLNLNPRQLHRNYYFRNINYANMSLISIDIEVGSDNHAKLYVRLNELIDKKQKFYACDGGCIDESVPLHINDRIEFPVKLTDPITAILYISSDKKHLDELKHTLHVKEVDIAPAQDVNTLAIHKHGHQYAGLATLFWTLFVFLIIIFHLFLFKLIYRELIAPAMDESNRAAGGSKYGDSIRSKYQRYARTV